MVPMTHDSLALFASIRRDARARCGTPVACSGGTATVTEVSLNDRSDTAKAFREEGVYRVLIVANKFQTGFDEPRLMAM